MAPETPSKIPVKIPSAAPSASSVVQSLVTAVDKRDSAGVAEGAGPVGKRAKPTTKFTAEARSTMQAAAAPPSTSNGGALLSTATNLGAKWDTKGRIEGLEGTIGALKESLESRIAACTDLEAQVEELHARISALGNENSELRSELVATQAQVQKNQLLDEEKAQNAQLVTQTGALKAQIAALQAELDSSRELCHALKAEGDQAHHNNALLMSQMEQLLSGHEHLTRGLEAARARVAELESERAGQLSELAAKAQVIAAMQAVQGGLQTDNASLQSQLGHWKHQFESTLGSLEQSRKQMLEMQDKLQQHERVRRKLHNAVQELRGNIRVFCRVRPPLASEGAAEQCLEVQPSMEEQEQIVLRQHVEGVTGQPEVKIFPFAFDRVFGPEAAQGAVFEEISQLVQSALDGYRVCIFAYGQTGSGKTHTMEGRQGDPGMIPLSVQQVFAAARDLAHDQRWQLSFECSYLEIYNEAIRDLLAASGSNGTVTLAQCMCLDSGLEIRHTPSGQTVVPELSVHPVTSVEGVMALLQRAAKSRAVAETLCNDRSSRSHSVFALRIACECNGQRTEGILNLIDLAGSERLSVSGSTGDRLKETQAINKSLSALGDVIAALAAKSEHVPFRNSKLTYLLQNSLGTTPQRRVRCVGGNCKTLMFVNVSPAAASAPETLCSLRFAAKVNSCHIGVAKRNSTATGKTKQ